MTVRDSRPAPPPSSSAQPSAEPPKRRSIARTALLVLPAQIGFRAIEATLPLLYAYWFGRGDATDVYVSSWAVFAFAGSLVFSMHQDSSLVPILAEERLLRPGGLARLRGSILAHTWVVGSLLSLLVGALALGWFRLRYADASFGIAARMVPPFCLVLVAMSTRTFFSTLCVVERQFFIQPIASFIGMFANVGILAATHSTAGIAFVPVATLAGELIAASVLAIFAIRSLGLRVALCFDRPPALLTVVRLASSEVGGGAVTRVNPVVDQFMAGLSAVVGGATLLKYSGDVATLPTSVVQAALLPVLISHLSDDFARRDLVTIRRTVVRSLASVCGLLLAASVLLYLVRFPLLRLVFLHGEMDAAGVDRMAQILPYHLVGLAPFGALLVLARAHVATKNGAIMFSMGVINATTNVVGNVILLRVLGLEGIALSTSIVQLAIAIIFWFRFEARLDALRTEPLSVAGENAA
ncbi:MAG TPA: lipid II flippase MurJ [Labilithrix sp.]|nr:lipid II flippase MurJ [Labilithrix sp.]